MQPSLAQSLMVVSQPGLSGKLILLIPQWGRERVARATTSGTLSGGGALGGALAGAKFGAFLGSFTANPTGIAVGGAVGGIVGGLIGSGLGQWAANGINSFMSDQIHG